MMLFVLTLSTLLLLLSIGARAEEKNTFNVGFMYAKEEELISFTEALEDKKILSPKDCGKHISCPKLAYTAHRLVPNPMAAAKLVCENLISKNVSVVITSSFPNNDIAAMAVSYTCGSKFIPVIGVSVRDNVFSDKNTHGWFMRTMSPWSDQAQAWTDLLLYFKWTHVIFIHSSDPDGRAVFGKFVAKAEKHDIELEQIMEYNAGFSNYTDKLQELHLKKSRIFILYATKEDADVIFEDAKRLKLLEEGYGWIVTEQSLRSSKVPDGVLGLQLSKGSHVEEHIQDAVFVVKKALRGLCKNSTENKYSCSKPLNSGNCDVESSHEWERQSEILFNRLRDTVLDDGETGNVRFNFMGDRIDATYEIMNVQSSGKLVKVGLHDGSKPVDAKVNISLSKIQWLGEAKEKPKGIRIATHLRVVTIKEIPFVYVENVSTADCKKSVQRVPCPRNYSGEIIEHCCYGYAIDMLIALAAETNFTYDLHLVGDGQFGNYEKRNGSSKKWNGMIGELIDNVADMIVAPLTINPERAEHIDFSKPFKYQGLTILVKKNEKDSSLGSFLQPFRDTLWVLVGLSVHVVALVLYLLDRFSPFGRFKLAKNDDTEEDALNLSSAMWFAWGVLLNSGIGEGTPRSFSARVLGMVWAGFAMIIVASYTANLAAFLVLDRPEAAISGIDDARLRNPQERFRYATVKNSAVAMYFKRQVELSTMYRTMEQLNYYEPEDAIRDVINDKLQAFIWDSSRLEFEEAKHCDLVTAGELFGRSGYGIGLPKDSPWTETISLAILSFHEKGEMEQLDGKWILVKDTNCVEKDQSPATLGLTNMAGVFMMVAGGIVAGVFLIIIEMAYKRHRGLKEKELELAKTAANRWRSNIERRRTLRTLAEQQLALPSTDTMDNKLTPMSAEKPNNIDITLRPSPSPSQGGYQRVPLYTKAYQSPLINKKN